MESLFQTPDLSHITYKDYENIYEPDQDSFLFLDSLEKEYSFIMKQDPFVIVEIGPGSGYTCLIKYLQDSIHPTITFAIDINHDACEVTKRTFKQNQISYGDVIQSNLLQSTLARLEHQVDILLFNPPYVPTSSEELFKPYICVSPTIHSSIESAYAGGKDGREVIDALLPDVKRLLSDKGVFYLLLEHNNKPDEVTQIMESYGLKGELIMKKQCRGEELMIIKYFFNVCLTYTKSLLTQFIQCLGQIGYQLR